MGRAAGLYAASRQADRASQVPSPGGWERQDRSLFPTPNPDPPSSIRGPRRRGGRSLGPEVDEGVGQGVDQIAGDHADLAILVAGDVAGQAVDVDAELSGLEGRELLTDQGRDDAAEDVAGAAGGHARVTGRVDVD